MRNISNLRICSNNVSLVNDTLPMNANFLFLSLLQPRKSVTRSKEKFEISHPSSSFYMLPKYLFADLIRNSFMTFSS